jgi:hypothetical protein
METSKLYVQICMIMVKLCRRFGMKKMAAGSFKTDCLAVIDQVQAKHVVA